MARFTGSVEWADKLTSWYKSVALRSVCVDSSSLGAECPDKVDAEMCVYYSQVRRQLLQIRMSHSLASIGTEWPYMSLVI